MNEIKETKELNDLSEEYRQILLKIEAFIEVNKLDYDEIWTKIGQYHGEGG